MNMNLNMNPVIFQSFNNAVKFLKKKFKKYFCCKLYISFLFNLVINSHQFIYNR